MVGARLSEAAASLEILRPDYPARLAHLAGMVLVDFVDLAPEIHGDPNSDVLRALDLADAWPQVGVIARTRDSRPPPPESRELLGQRVQALGDKLRCVNIALEGSGFRTVAFRSFISAARLLRIVKTPIEIHGSLSEAVSSAYRVLDVSAGLRGPVDQFFGLSDG